MPPAAPPEKRARLLLRRLGSGSEAAAAWARQLEQQLSCCLPAALPPGVCLTAAGGLGRRQSFPGADLDLILLEEVKGRAAELAATLGAALWDAGFTVSLCTHTPPEGLALAAADWRVFTEWLDLRPLAGERALFLRAVEEARQAVIRPRREAFRQWLQELRRERREELIDYFPPLEPDLKNGPGGLRDLLQAQWLSRALEMAGEAPAALPPAERRRWREAAAVLLTHRFALRCLNGGRGDRLKMEFHAPLARLLARMQGLAPDLSRWSRECHGALETVRDLSQALIDGRDISPAGRPKRRPEGEDFLSRAWREGTFLPAAAAGEIDRALPEWRGIRHLALADPWHRYPVDHHSLLAAECLLRLLRGRWPGAPALLSPLAAAVQKPEGLLLAALLHDSGKGGGSGHSERGARLARRAARRLRLEKTAAADLVFLVREHLCLGRGARRLDQDDPVLMQRLARAIGSVARLDALLLLTYADYRASHLEAWNRWREDLILGLYRRLRNLLAEEAEHGAAGALLRMRRREISLSPALRRWARRMPRSYLLSAHAAQAAAHLQLCQEATCRGLTLALDPLLPGQVQLTVCAPDRVGLFADLCGALSLLRLNILSSQVFSSRDGLALDFFQLAHPDGQPPPALLSSLRELLPQVLAGTFDLAARLAQRRQRSGMPAAPRARREVTFDQRSSRRFTVVELYAPDRVGLLYDVSAAFSACDVDLHLARIDTRGAEAADLFFVQERGGGKIRSRRRLQQLRRKLLAAVR